MAVKKKRENTSPPRPQKKKISEKRGPLTDFLSGSDLRLSPLLPKRLLRRLPQLHGNRLGRFKMTSSLPF